MRTQYVSTLPLDQDRLRKDLEHSGSFRYSEAYSDYLIGGPWKSCMLWSRGGDSGDGFLTNYSYDQQPAFTESGRELPYVQEIITKVADLGRLNFVRLAVFSDSVIVPHRDFLELAEIPEGARSAHRVHIPLATHDECYFSDRNVVYRMRQGEVWFFDAAQIHSVASFSKQPRVHLIFDLVDIPAPGPLVKVGDGSVDGTIPPDRVVRRPALPAAERDTVMRLAEALSMDTFNEVFSIVIKKHFRYDGGEHFAWETMTALARACADPAVLPHTQQARKYFELERTS